jgi:hypothetical protein
MRAALSTSMLSARRWLAWQGGRDVFLYAFPPNRIGGPESGSGAGPGSDRWRLRLRTHGGRWRGYAPSSLCDGPRIEAAEFAVVGHLAMLWSVADIFGKPFPASATASHGGARATVPPIRSKASSSRSTGIDPAPSHVAAVLASVGNVLMPVAEHSRRYGGDSHCASTFTASRGHLRPRGRLLKRHLSSFRPTRSIRESRTPVRWQVCDSVRSPCNDGPAVAMWAHARTRVCIRLTSFIGNATYPHLKRHRIHWRPETKSKSVETQAT